MAFSEIRWQFACFTSISGACLKNGIYFYQLRLLSISICLKCVFRKRIAPGHSCNLWQADSPEKHVSPIEGRRSLIERVTIWDGSTLALGTPMARPSGGLPHSRLLVADNAGGRGRSHTVIHKPKQTMHQSIKISAPNKPQTRGESCGGGCRGWGIRGGGTIIDAVHQLKANSCHLQSPIARKVLIELRPRDRLRLQLGARLA